MKRETKNLAGKAGLLFVLTLGAQAVLAEEVANVFLPPTGEPGAAILGAAVEPKITTDPTFEPPATGGPDPVPQLMTATGGPDPVPEELMTSTGVPGEGEFPVAYSMGRSGDDPLPYERTMTMSSEMQDVPVLSKTEEALTALPPISADAVSAVATLERESAISTLQDSAPAVDAAQVVGSAADSVNAAGPAIRNGRLVTP